MTCIAYPENLADATFLHKTKEVLVSHRLSARAESGGRTVYPCTCNPNGLYASRDEWENHRADVVAEAVFGDMERYVFEVNQANGWHEDERSFGDGIALTHSELSEALDAYRDWGLVDMTGVAELEKAIEKDGETVFKPLGVGSEFGDVQVRLLDATKRDDFNIWREFKRKMLFNMLRGWKHGGKRF